MAGAVVFGGAGFIGSYLVRDLVARGYRPVISADRLMPPSPVSGAAYLTLDVREPIAMRLDEEIDEVYNLAAVHHTPGHPDHEYFETNVAGAENVTAFCTANNITNLVFTSSISVYGPSEEAKEEGSIPAPVSAYGKSKLQAERIHLDWVNADRGRRLAISRPAVVFGPGEGGNFTRLAQALKRRVFIYPGRRDAVKGCGYVGELVRTFPFALAKADPVFLYNFCYPQAYTTEDICHAFNRIAGLPLPQFCLPSRVMLAAAYGFEVLSRLGVKTSINRPRVRKLIQSTNIAPKALTDAGYDYLSDLDSGLQWWLRESAAGRFE